ncbi:24728_t:CDS:2 [Racocetra persica]|uniref:24728_t:CDS:1 n=1 Tax=Racocetra persica TaxID=160502 RepID=A0ACA9MD62_9GLOM|nr:24728_t:CDS:2 [Racocetra persica]
MFAKNLSSKEKRALSTALDLIKNFDNKVFHIFEDGESSYSIIGSQKLSMKMYCIVIPEVAKLKQSYDKQLFELDNYKNRNTEGEDNSDVDIPKHVILYKDDKKRIISYFKNFFDPINADLSKQITDNFNLEFKNQKEFADFLLNQIETKGKKFNKKVGVSTVNEFVNARSKAIKAIKIDEAFSSVVISLTSIYKSKSEPLIDYLITVKDKYEFEYD